MANRGVRALFDTLTRRDDTEVVYECRRCGTTLDATDETCPSCDSDEVQQFVI